MSVNYKKLFHLMIDKEISQTELMRDAGFSANIISRLKKDEYVSMETIEKICWVLDCGVDDILSFTHQKNEKGKVQK